MFQNFDPQNPTEPLSLGNVVKAGLRLYRSHLKSYFLLALTASFWSFLPFLFIVSGRLLIYASHATDLPLAWFFLFVIGLTLYFYALGKSLVNASMISRLAFAELINQPETVAFARSQVQPRLWRFVRTSLLLFIILFGLCLLLGIFLIIPLLNLLAFFPVIATFLWFIARFLLIDAILAIEENRSAIDTVSRSWELTRGNAWRIVLIFLVVLLITLPLQILVQLIDRGILLVVIKPIQSDVPYDSTRAVSLVIVLSLIGIVISLLLRSLIIPFWQAIKGVIYYDLRNRQEELGLQLHEHPTNEPS